MRKPLLASIIGLTVASFALADDWPQFRGPDRTGVSKEKGLLKAWPKGGPKLVWTYKDAGQGHASVAVVKGVLYTLGTDMGFKDDIIIALDEKTGKKLWDHKIGPIYTYKGNAYGDGPRSTPTIDGDFLYALGGLGDLVCINLVTKKEVWRKNLPDDLKGEMMGKYGHSEGLLIDGDLLICTPGGAQGTLAALDKKTGAVKWRSKGWIETASYATPVVAEVHKVRQIFQVGYTGGTAGASLAAIDAKTGDLLWKKKIATGDNDGISTSPIVQGNEVYVTAGHGGGCHVFEINAKQEAKALYSNSVSKRVKNTHGGMVLIGDHIYGHTENESWVCQDWKTGSDDPPPAGTGWLERVQLKCKSGALTAAEGLLYLYTDEGEVALVEATPKVQFNLISSFTIPQKSPIRGAGTSRNSRVWAHPVIANGHLFLRDQEFIFAYAIK